LADDRHKLCPARETLSDSRDRDRLGGEVDMVEELGDDGRSPPRISSTLEPV